MQKDTLVHLIYASTAVQKFTDNALIELLSAARKKNHNMNITGMLLYSEGNFFQVLEGNRLDVEKLFETIKTDKRHHHVTQIIYEPIPTRIFSEWSMGFTNITQQQLNTIDGLNDFFTKGTCLADIDMGRSKKLLKAFSSGYWQRSLN